MLMRRSVPSASRRPSNNALKLTAQGRGWVGCGAPQLNAVFDGRGGAAIID
jgi:hypothetical protein